VSENGGFVLENEPTGEAFQEVKYGFLEVLLAPLSPLSYTLRASAQRDAVSALP
jgi:hypothetical protein